MKKWITNLFRSNRPRTADERFAAAKLLLRNTAPEVLHDAMLIVAMASPMTLVELLRECGASVVEKPVPSARETGSKSKEIVN